MHRAKLSDKSLLNVNEMCDISNESNDKSKLILAKMINSLINKPSDESLNLGFGEEDETDDEEYIEYIYSPRQYFLQSLCQFCKESLSRIILCDECKMVSYCSFEHLVQDRRSHQDFCMAIKMIALQRGGHVYAATKGYSHKQYQTIQVSTIDTCESILGRPLFIFEKEILLFPRICNNKDCHEWRVDQLADCNFCKQVSFCRNHPNHLPDSHKKDCKHLKLFERIVAHQAKFGKIAPILPSKVIDESMQHLSSMNQIFGKLYQKLTDIKNLIFYTELTQIASPVLTVWYGLKLAELLHSPKLVLHIIGAEQYFEVDTLEKWEAFLLHLMPHLMSLDIVFVGPELNIPPEQLAVLRKRRLCRSCRQQKKAINYHFENSLYHDYLSTASYMEPSYVCFFNPGLYRSTAYNSSNTWPQTIKATISAKCSVLITSYTNYESELDLKTYLQESDRPIEIILPVIINPFRSQRPERNLTSEDQAALIYKNYYLFIVK